MIVYGKNVFDQIQDRPDQIEEIYQLEGSKNPQIEAFHRRYPKIPLYSVSRKRLDVLANRGVHQGIVAKVKNIPMLSLEQLIARCKSPALLVLLDHIQDPHNLGAILRSAKAAGADGVVFTKHESAELTATAIKSSAGAAYSLPLCVVTNLSQAIETLKENGFWVVGTGFQNARDYRQGLYDQNIALIIGNEGKGISPKVLKACDYLVRIPMADDFDSLNASVAAGIVLYEIHNQRHPLS